MGMAGAGEIFRRATEFHQHCGFVDHFAGAEADDVSPKHAIASRVGKDFDEAVKKLEQVRPRKAKPKSNDP